MVCSVAAMDMQRETQRRLQEQEAWIRHQQLLVDAEQKQREAMVEEERKLATQRTRLAAMNRELRSKELQLLGAVKQKFLVEQQQQQEMNVVRLADDLRKKVSCFSCRINAHYWRCCIAVLTSFFSISDTVCVVYVQAERREEETRAAIEDVEVRNMDLEVKRKLLQQELEQRRLETERRERMEMNYRLLHDERSAANASRVRLSSPVQVRG